MRIKKLLALTLILPLPLAMAASSTVAAQNRCGTPVPTPEEQQDLADALEAWVGSRIEGLTSVVTIPVAFHVVRDDAGNFNVTDQQIYDQIDVLDASFLGTLFQFTLVSIDRVNNSAWSDGVSQEAAMKAALAVDPATTFNIYTANLPGGLLGYAWFPWSFPEDSHMHGIVNHWNSLPGGGIPNYNEGDTVVHEAGHFFGLWHTFQGGCTPPGDEVEDTPYEATSTEGCPVGKDTCPALGADPIHNFMDYSFDPCMYEFTPGQAVRSEQVTTFYRPTMVTVTTVVEYPGEGFYLTLQAAIDAVPAGTTVEVDGYRVTESDPEPAIRIKRGVLVRAKPGEPAPVINAQGAGSGVIFPSNSDALTEISGFLVKNFSINGIEVERDPIQESTTATVTACSIVGGNVGVFAEEANLVVRDCVIRDQSGAIPPAGIYLEDYWFTATISSRLDP